MLARDGVNFFRLLSGVYGIISLFLPWWVTESDRHFYQLTLLPNQWVDFQDPFLRPVPYYVLTHISAILTITLAVMIFGCFTAFLSNLTPGMRGRVLVFSAGISFSLAPILFVLSLNSLFSSLGMIFWGTSSYSSSVSLGFFMAFVAAVPAFVSLSNLRRIKFFLLTWVMLSLVFFIVFAFEYHWFWERYGVPWGSLMLVSFLDSLIVTSISTLVYGIYKLLKKK